MSLNNETCPYCGAAVYSVAMHIFTCPKNVVEDQGEVVEKPIAPEKAAKIEDAVRGAADCLRVTLERGRRAESILRRLASARHVTLGDLVYDVREREGEGWDGPAVKSWGEVCSDLAAFLREFPE